MIEGVVELLGEAANSKGLELLYSVPTDMPLLRGDPDRIRQIVRWSPVFNTSWARVSSTE